MAKVVAKIEKIEEKKAPAVSIDDDDEDEYEDEDFRRPLPQESKNLLGALSLMVNRDRYADCIFHVGKPNEPKRTFYAHKIILASASPIFEAMLYPPRFHSSSSSQQNFPSKSKLEIQVNDCSSRAFRVMLQCLYTDKCQIKAEDLSDVIYIAKKYNLDPLKAAIAEFLETGITVENACILFSLSLKEGFASIPSSPSSSKSTSSKNAEQQATINFIEENAEDVLRSSGFLELPVEAVRALISSDRLAIDEVSLFKCLLRWAQKECARRKAPSFSSNYSSLLDEEETDAEQIKRDLEAVASVFRRPKESAFVRSVLEEVLDCVRFPLMTAEELAMEIMPVGLLTDQDLVLLFTYICGTKKNVKIKWNTRQRQWKANWSINTQFMSPNVQLSHGNFCISTNGGGHQWTLGTLEMKPKSGKHCWRIFRLQGNTQWLMLGVSTVTNFPANSYNSPGVWGISSAAQLYQNGVNNMYNNGQVNMVPGPLDCEYDSDTGTFTVINLAMPATRISFAVNPAQPTNFVPHIAPHSIQQLVVLPIKAADFGQVQSLKKQKVPPELKPLLPQITTNMNLNQDPFAPQPLNDDFGDGEEEPLNDDLF